MTELDIDGEPLYTYRQAAVKVRRSVRTVWRWRKGGMEMTWGIRDGQRVRLVREDVLLAYWRERMRGWPVHQYRLRKQREGIQG